MKRFLVTAFVAASALLAGCGSITTAVDCNTICNRYQTCYNKNYDTGACETRCRSHANSDSDYMQRSQTCTACLDNNKDCTSTTFACGVQCSGIVP